jgi:hypothetical protein
MKGRNSLALSFDTVGIRPQPRITSVEQTLRATLIADIPNAVASTVISPVYSAFNIALSSFSDYAEYTGLFDQYRIVQAEVWLVPNSVVTNTAMGDVVTAVDLDDANTPTSFNQVASKGGALITGGQAGHYHCWEPHVALAAYSGAFTSYANEGPQWIDSGSPAVSHFGFKTAIQTSGVVTGYNLQCRILVEFRAPGI